MDEESMECSEQGRVGAGDPALDLRRRRGVVPGHVTKGGIWTGTVFR